MDRFGLLLVVAFGASASPSPSCSPNPITGQVPLTVGPCDGGACPSGSQCVDTFCCPNTEKQCDSATCGDCTNEGCAWNFISGTCEQECPDNSAVTNCAVEFNMCVETSFVEGNCRRRCGNQFSRGWFEQPVTGRRLLETPEKAEPIKILSSQEEYSQFIEDIVAALKNESLSVEHRGELTTLKEAMLQKGEIDHDYEGAIALASNNDQLNRYFGFNGRQIYLPPYRMPPRRRCGYWPWGPCARRRAPPPPTIPVCPNRPNDPECKCSCDNDCVNRGTCCFDQAERCL